MIESNKLTKIGVAYILNKYVKMARVVFLIVPEHVSPPVLNLFEKPDETIAECEITGIGQRELAKKLCSRHLIIDIIGQYHSTRALHPFWKNTTFIHCVVF